MKLSLLLLGLLVIYASTQTFDAKLALTWPAGHCEYLANSGRECDPKLVSNWDGRSFTVHGYWPETSSSKDFGSFNLDILRHIRPQLERHWPPRAEAFRRTRPSARDRFFLWIHQWDKHGKDFGEIALKLLGTSLPSSEKDRNEAIQRLYFADVLDLYGRIVGRRLKVNSKNKRDLAAQLGIPESYFITRCQPSGNLQEIQICTQIKKGTGFPSSLSYQFVKCAKGKSNCKGKAVSLSGFK